MKNDRSSGATGDKQMYRILGLSMNQLSRSLQPPMLLLLLLLTSLMNWFRIGLSHSARSRRTNSDVLIGCLATEGANDLWRPVQTHDRARRDSRSRRNARIEIINWNHKCLPKLGGTDFCHGLQRRRADRDIQACKFAKYFANLLTIGTGHIVLIMHDALRHSL